MSKNNQNRQSVEIADPCPGQATQHISRQRAIEHCNAGLAYWLKDGRIKYRTYSGQSVRKASDAYVNGEFEIKVLHRRTYPVTQWLHGEILD
jgi:hypothetical protein